MAPNNKQNGKLRILGYGVAIAATIGTAAWLSWKAYVEDSERNGTLDSKKYSSRCIIITKSIVDIGTIEWRRILRDPSIVVVVAPSVEFPDTTSTDKQVSSSDLYKVIHCETIAGVWACVKSLKKDELVVDSSDFEEGVPGDIIRYVKHISDVHEQSEIETALGI